MSIEEKAKRYDELFVKAKQIYDKENKVDVIENFDTEFEKQVSRLIASVLSKEYEYTESFVKWVSNSLLGYAKHEIEKQGEQEHVIITKIAPKFEIGDTIRNKITNEVFTITNRCISLEYYHDIHHLHEVKFSEQDNWELLKQKSADKVEPKFRNGQWIVWQYKCYKVNYNGCGYELVDQDGLSTSLEYGTIDENARLWDIAKDVKDGDVLYAKGNCFKEYLFMFSSFTEDNVISTHFGYDVFYGTFDKKLTRFGRKEDFISVTPATKEQRDILMKAMSDAGYTFDFEKKELNKIKQNPVEWHREDEQNLNACFGYIPDEFLRRWLTDIIHVKYDKPAWSEEDKANLSLILQVLWNKTKIGTETCKKLEDWLKSLKDRVQPQQQQDWSEEDERTYRGLHNLIYSTPYCDSRKELSDWLKSLKDRVQPKNHACSEDDEKIAKTIINEFGQCSEWCCANGLTKEAINWLKSLRPQNR